MSALDDITQEDMENALLNAIFDAVRRQDERRLCPNRYAERQEASLRAALHRIRQAAQQEVQA